MWRKKHSEVRIRQSDRSEAHGLTNGPGRRRSGHPATREIQSDLGAQDDLAPTSTRPSIESSRMVSVVAFRPGHFRAALLVVGRLRLWRFGPRERADDSLAQDVVDGDDEPAEDGADQHARGDDDAQGVAAVSP